MTGVQTCALPILRIFEYSGKLISEIHNGLLESGTHDFIWNTDLKSNSTLPAGNYICIVTANGISHYKIISLIK